LPHLLVYGSNGAGKKTRIAALLREIYGVSVERCKTEHKSVALPNRSDKLDIVCLVSNYHVELTPADAGVHDRVIVQEVIKEIAQSRPVDARAHPFKVVVMHDVDRLSRGAQHALRRTMELYMGTCRLILCCNSTGKVIDALHSRCLLLRVPAPTHAELVGVLMSISAKENLGLTAELAELVAVASERNARRAILMLEAMKARQHPFTPGTQPELADWQKHVAIIVSDVLREQSPNQLLAVRGKLYELLGHCVPASLLLRELCDGLLAKCDTAIAPVIVEHAAAFERRLGDGGKAIIHLEAFIARFMTVYKRHLLGGL
jgi:replication factor C subunit 3/5